MNKSLENGEQESYLQWRLKDDHLAKGVCLEECSKWVHDT